LLNRLWCKPTYHDELSWIKNRKLCSRSNYWASYLANIMLRVNNNRTCNHLIDVAYVVYMAGEWVHIHLWYFQHSWGSIPILVGILINENMQHKRIHKELSSSLIFTHVNSLLFLHIILKLIWLNQLCQLNDLSILINLRFTPWHVQLSINSKFIMTCVFISINIHFSVVFFYLCSTN